MIAVTVFAAIGCGGERPQAAPANAQTPAAPAASGSASSAGSSSVTGSVKFSGTAPAKERIKMDADPQCALQHQEPAYKEDVVVNANGTLKNVFVHVTKGLEGRTFTPPTQSAKLDQHGCAYTPRVIGVQVNQPFEVVNSDPTLHNVNCKPVKNKPFNIAQPVKGMKSTKTFTTPEVMVKCICNVHPWMASFIGVVDNPYYAVTGDDGSFSLTGLPAGSYTIEAWHETLGTQTQTATIGDGDVKSVNFEFKGQ
jgi:hypothetical protein